MGTGVKGVSMKKLLILFAFLTVCGFSQKSQAQCSSLGCGLGAGYFFDAAAYTYVWDNAPNYLKAAFGIDMAFSAIYSSINLLEEGKALENRINSQRNALENYNSVKRYYTEGIPPFATRGPDGRPRSPKITWSDVESIR